MKLLVGTILFLSATIALSNSYVDGLPRGFQNWDAVSKQGYLWQLSSKNPYAELPPPKNPGPLQFLSMFSPAFLSRSFDTASDEMPANRLKLIHTYGSVAAADFVPAEGTPYTGVFETGARGLIRLSVATDPRPPASFTPGMALKFLVDGNPSVNLMVMEKLEGQGNDRNFFARTFSNDLPAPTTARTKLLVRLFSLVKKDAGHLSVGHLAKTDGAGRRIESPVWPWKVLFVPLQKNLIDPLTKNDFRAELGKVQPGTVLYEVWAKRSPTDQPHLIGRLVTRTGFVASEYGDRNLFFQHDRSPQP